jgi:hypothetical protein
MLYQSANLALRLQHPARMSVMSNWKPREGAARCCSEARDFEGVTGIAGGCFSAETPRPEPTMTIENKTRYAWVALPETWKTER